MNSSSVNTRTKFSRKKYLISFYFFFSTLPIYIMTLLTFKFKYNGFKAQQILFSLSSCFIAYENNVSYEHEHKSEKMSVVREANK